MLSICLSALIALQDGKDAEPKASLWESLAAEMDIRAAVATGEEHASRFFEYRDIPLFYQLATLDVHSIRDKDDTYTFRLKVIEAPLDTQSVSMEWGKIGAYTLTFSWQRIPHRFGFNGTTLYSGLGTGTLLIPDATQAALQGSANSTVAATNLRNFVAADSIALSGAGDVMVMRDRFSAGVSLVSLDPWRVSVGVDFEQKEGLLPIWGSFGFSNTVQILDPVAFESWTFNVAVTYADKPVDVGFFYTSSLFHNRENDLAWDNPFRNVDATAANAFAVLNTSGARMGRMALEADNAMQKFSVRGGYNLSNDARLMADAAFSWRTSDVNLLPYSTNTAIVAPLVASDPASLPTRDFSGEVFTQSFQLSLVARPMPNVDAKVYGRYYDFDDRRQEILFPGYVRVDATWNPVAIENEPLDYLHWVVGTSETIRITGLSSRVKPSYEYGQWERENRQVGKVVEHTIGLGFETDWSDSIRTKVGAAMARRHGSDYKPDPDNLSFLRMLDQSDRERLQGNAQIDVAVSEQFSAGARYAVTYDNYEVRFGLRDASRHEASLDASIRPIDAVTMTCFVAYEIYETKQKGRQWVPGGLGDPTTVGGAQFENNSNWDERVYEQIVTVGVRPEWKVSESVQASAQLAYVWNQAHIHLVSPVGTAADDNNAFDPIRLDNAETSRRVSLEVKLTVRVSDKASFYIGYQLDDFASGNFYNDGITSVPTSPAGAYSGAYPLRLTYEDAVVHLGYLGFSVRY